MEFVIKKKLLAVTVTALTVGNTSVHATVATSPSKLSSME